MFAHLPSRERTIYVSLFVLFLCFAAYVGGKQFRRPAPLVIQENSPPRSPETAPSERMHSPQPDVVVHVIGAVLKPGVYHLPFDSRVADAVLAAGGAKEADSERLNLAAKLIDGTQLQVPKKGEDLSHASNSPYRATDFADSPYNAQPSAPATSGKKSGKAPSSPIDLNSASLEQLESVPGIGPATAQRILDYRTQHGAFRSVDELTAVGGIGQKKLERMKPYLRL